MFALLLQAPFRYWRKAVATEVVAVTVHSFTGISAAVLVAHAIVALSAKGVWGFDFLTLFLAVLTAKAMVVLLMIGTFMGMGLASLPVWREAYTPATRVHLMAAPLVGFVIAANMQSYEIPSVRGFMGVAYDKMIDGATVGFLVGLGMHLLLLGVVVVSATFSFLAMHDAAKVLPNDPVRRPWIGAGYLLSAVAWSVGLALLLY